MSSRQVCTDMMIHTSQLPNNTSLSLTALETRPNIPHSFEEDHTTSRSTQFHYFHTLYSYLLSSDGNIINSYALMIDHKIFCHRSNSIIITNNDLSRPPAIGVPPFTHLVVSIDICPSGHQRLDNFEIIIFAGPNKGRSSIL